MINIQSLHFSYQRKMVFDGLSLEFKPGSIYGLLGKNGTGKSTLLRNIQGLLFPDAGSIDVLGYIPRQRRPKFLQEVFMIPEEFYLPNISIAQYVRSNAPFYPKYDQHQFEACLKEFDIPQEQTLQQMSYGQKKKVLISFAIACNTSVLLMDEPSNGLDIMSKSQFRKVLAGAISDRRCIIISTHQVKDLEALIDHITIIDEGKILFNHDMNEIQQNLLFEVSFNPGDVHNALYAEQALTGNLVIIPNNGQPSGKVDLELLYKAVVTNGAAIENAFRNQHSLS